MPHLKKDSQLDKVKFRTVTVLSVVSRIFEHQQLADLFENIFHKTCLCSENITVVLQHFSHLLNNGRKISTNTIGTITTDLSKAFLLFITRSYLGETKSLWPK